MAWKYWIVGTQFEFPPTQMVTMKTAADYKMLEIVAKMGV